MRYQLVMVAALGACAATGSAGAAVLAPGDPSETFEAVTVVESLTSPTDIAVLPDGKLLVTERNGDVVLVGPSGDGTRQHIDVLSKHGEQGLLGVVLDPSFPENRWVYFFATFLTEAVNRHRVVRYRLDEQGTLTEAKIIVLQGLRGPSNHNGGGLAFHDGALYISVGDTGSNASPPVNKFGSCLNVTSGKILRVDPETGEALPDNPFASLDLATGCGGVTAPFDLRPPDKRVFAWGLRNPFRFWVDPRTGKMWIGDVGEDTQEEISVAERGQHLGWPFFEGTVEYNQDFKPPGACAALTPSAPCVAPVFSYGRVPVPKGGAVIGGRILDGCEWPQRWQQRYIFGDHAQNRVWTLDVNAERDGVLADSLRDFASVGGLAAIRLGSDNALYLVEHTAGVVSRFTARGAPSDITCAREPLGSACASGDVCDSGECVDGVCCENACDGVCVACSSALTGGEGGACLAVADGEDPEDECATPDGVSASCAGGGSCDGDGACRELAPAGTACSHCGDGRLIVGICDDAGGCAAEDSIDCAPFACTVEGCLDSCDGDADCVRDAACQAGVCEHAGGKGAGGGGAGGGGVGGGGEGAHDGGAMEPGSEPANDAGCGCSVPGRASSSPALWLLLAIGALARCRPRKVVLSRPAMQRTSLHAGS